MEGILKLTSKQLSYLSKAITAERFGQEEVTNTTRNTLTAQEHDELNESINRLICVVKDQPLERIPEETRPTGEEEVKKLEDWLVCEICMKQSDRKRMDKELIRRGEFEVETRKRVKRVLSLAREEGKEEQAELDRKIYGMSVEEFSKNYKVVEPLQNGEREEIVSLLTGWISNPTVVKTILEKIDEMLSQSKKESYQSGCEDMLRDTCTKIALFIGSESGKSGRKEILKFIESLTNQSKENE